MMSNMAFGEDIVAIELMLTLIDKDRAEFKELNINADKCAVLFRRKMLEWVLEEHPDFEVD